MHLRAPPVARAIERGADSRVRESALGDAHAPSAQANAHTRSAVPDAARGLPPHRAAWSLCGSREDAEDLVQETFARVLSRKRVLHGDDDLYYLMRVLRNTFLTGRRTASRRPVTVATLEDVVAADPTPMARPEQAFEVQEVYATIAQLPEGSSARARRRRCARALLPRGLAGAARARGDADDAPAPRAQAGRQAARPEAPAGARADAARGDGAAGGNPARKPAAREETDASGVMSSGRTQ